MSQNPGTETPDPSPTTSPAPQPLPPQSPRPPRATFERGPDWQPREIWGYANGGTGLTRCGRCRQVWWQSGEYTSHCAGCCRTFTSLAGFDTHHQADDTPKGSHCVDPETFTHEDGSPMFEVVEKPRYGATVTRYWQLT